MHEFSLMADLMRKIETISRDNGNARIAAVKVNLGALAHISADHFREHFVDAARGTAAENAELTVEQFTDEHDPHAQDITLESVEIVE